MARKKIGRWRVLRLRGLQRRWLFNTVMPVFLLLILLVVAFSVGICSYYYGSMQKGLESRAQAMANSFNDYFMDSGYNTYYRWQSDLRSPLRTKTALRCNLSTAAGGFRFPPPA